MLTAADTFTGWATVGLGGVTLVLALSSLLALREARADRRLARETLAAQARPILLRSFVDSTRKETISVSARGAVAAYGTFEIDLGRPVVEAGFDWASRACWCSVVVRNAGRGGGEILSARLRSLDTLPEGAPMYADAYPEANVLAVGDWTRITADLLPEAPAWFWRTVTNKDRLFFEVTYTDLDMVRTETIWFEVLPDANGEGWKMGAVLRSEPPMVSGTGTTTGRA